MSRPDPSSQDRDADPDAGATGDGEFRDPARVGDPRVDAVLEALERDSTLPPAEQIGGYDAAHRTLQEILAAIDEGQG